MELDVNGQKLQQKYASFNGGILMVIYLNAMVESKQTTRLWRSSTTRL